MFKVFLFHILNNSNELKPFNDTNCNFPFFFTILLLFYFLYKYIEMIIFYLPSIFDVFINYSRHSNSHQSEIPT